MSTTTTTKLRVDANAQEERAMAERATTERLIAERETTECMTGALVPVAPTVSVVIPAYNVAQFIGETLASVFNQTFSDYEVIVINDGSPDTTELEAVLAPYMNRIKYLKQENRGLSGARNAGVRAARGAFIALLDSDDAWQPEYLATQIELMRRDETIDVLYCDAHIFGEGVPANLKFTDGSPSAGEVSFESLVRQECNVMVSVTARRATLINVGLFDESLRSSEDFDMWLRIAKAGGRIAYHRQPLVRYRRRPGSLSADSVWMYQHILAVLDKSARTMTLSSQEDAVLQQERARFQSMLWLHEGKRALASGDHEAATQGLTQANRFLKSPKLAATLLLLRFAPKTLRRVYKLRDRFIFRTGTQA
jgi:GT2 family glycosyltransferase